MNHTSSKAIKDSDPHEEETEDSPSAIHLNDGDLQISLAENPKSNIHPKQAKKSKNEIQQVEEYIETILKLTRKQRVKGSLSEYFTCHGCNGFMERKYLLVCCHKDCQRYFCFRCANKKFHSTPEEIANLIKEDDWYCYSCTQLCNCRLCKKMNLDKEDMFPHQLTKFERAKKQPSTKNEEKDDKSAKSEDKSNESDDSDIKPEVKKGGRGKQENRVQASKSEDKKGNKKQDDKENKQEKSKETTKSKVGESKEKPGKEKGVQTVQKDVGDVTKEIKRMLGSKDDNKLNAKNDKKVPTQKITSLLTKSNKTSKFSNRGKKRDAKSEESEESSEQEEIVEIVKAKTVNDEDKKISGKESTLSRTNSEKEPPKPSKTENTKNEKPKEAGKIDDKKFKQPKIKRELRQLLKMNDEANEFSKFLAEESFEMSNSLPVLDEKENSRSNQIEPKKVVRRFRAKPDEVCHICKNIFEKEHMYPCTVPGCDKSFCSFCIQSNFIQDFDPKAFKADQFICYVCGKFCKCKECDKSHYHANKRRARRNEMRMGSSRRSRRVRGRGRVIETRRRKFYDNLPDDFIPGGLANENSNTMDKFDYSYDRDLEDELEDRSDSEESNESDVETMNKFRMRKMRLRKGAIPLKALQEKAKGSGHDAGKSVEVLDSKNEIESEMKDENNTNKH